MESRRPSGPPSDRLARLLAEGGDGGRGDVRGEPLTDEPSDDDEDVVDPAGEVLDAGWTEELPGGGRHRARAVPLLSVPASLRAADLAVGARAVRGLLVLAVLAALVLGGRWLWSQRPAAASSSERVVAQAAEGRAGDGQVDAGQADEAQVDEAQPNEAQVEAQADDDVPATAAPGVEGDAPTGAATDLVVHVTGQVEDPGVVELPTGSRVVDAVRAAGGLTAEADQSAVNLARVLVDGEQLWVGRPGEEPPPGWSPPVASGAGQAGDAPDGATTAPLDLNAATRADLEELPGVGPVTAGHILAWRDEHGRFSRVDELLEVSGIGERTLAQLEPLVTVGG